MVQAGDEGIRFLLVSGKPLEEPVAWYGPIVMNTQEQLRNAFDELERGTFLKNKPKPVGRQPAGSGGNVALPLYPSRCPILPHLARVGFLTLLSS